MPDCLLHIIRCVELHVGVTSGKAMEPVCREVYVLDGAVGGEDLCDVVFVDVPGQGADV